MNLFKTDMPCRYIRFLSDLILSDGSCSENFVQNHVISPVDKLFEQWYTVCKFFRKRNTNMKRFTKIMNVCNVNMVWYPADYDNRTGVCSSYSFF